MNKFIIKSGIWSKVLLLLVIFGLLSLRIVLAINSNPCTISSLTVDTSNCDSENCTINKILTVSVQLENCNIQNYHANVTLYSANAACINIDVPISDTHALLSESKDHIISLSDIESCPDDLITNITAYLLADPNVATTTLTSPQFRLKNVCGDNVIVASDNEQCDNGTLNTNTPPYGSGVYCTTSCQRRTAPYCGDGTCQASNETYANCPQDCSGNINGWNIPLGQGGWSLSSGGYLEASNSTITIISPGFDIRSRTVYVLKSSAYGLSSGTCDINISLDPFCTSATNWTTTDCGIGNSGANITIGAKLNVWNSSAAVFTLSDNKYAVDNGTGSSYFRDVHLIIDTGSCNGGALIGNISLTAVTDNNISYSSPNTPVSGYLSGCCPANYCWNGTSCVNSDLWMNNATYPAVWNSLFDTEWTNLHVNSSQIPASAGYRCMVLNDSVGAQWVPSTIKYDWNYTTSGYCLRPTDCFVGPNVNANDYAGLNSSDECVNDTTIVDNYYCNAGNWTSKSYVIATFLQNISGNHPYVLYCDTNRTLLYNIDPLGSDTDVTSACVIIVNDTSGIHVTQGIAVVKTQEDTFLSYAANSYTGNTTLPSSISLSDCSITEGFTTGDGESFTRCIYATKPDLFVYYNENYSYFVISQTNLAPGTGLTLVWNIVKGFFTNLFSSPARYGSTYALASHISSYDRIYVYYNGTNTTATALEEAKYDEGLQRVLQTLYVDYSSVNTTTNPLNMVDIFNYANSTAPDNLYMNYTLNDTSNAQEIIIKSNDKTGLWQYFTTILRPINVQ